MSGVAERWRRTPAGRPGWEVGDVLKERIHVLFVDGATNNDEARCPVAADCLEVDPGDALGGAVVVAVVAAERRKKKWYLARPFVVVLRTGKRRTAPRR
jgi:hypothetical protein